ncbi:MAG: TetR family transcriptional regulator [Actinomycetia bacterium]|nr:TetR family transcriptional regulator [Actinomycetes bacterium]
MTPATRRRGTELEQAIFDAVFEQLGAVGYARLTMEGVAASAHTGKAALYRRWASREDLLRDALEHALPAPAEVPQHGNIHDDLLELLRCYRDVTEVTKGAVFKLLKIDGEDGYVLLHSVVRERVVAPLRQMILDALRRGAERGDVRPEAATRQVAHVGPAMVMYHCLTESADLPDEMLISIVDEILMPIVTVSGGPGRLSPTGTGPGR